MGSNNTVDIDPAIRAKVLAVHDQTELATGEALRLVSALRAKAATRPFGTSKAGAHLTAVLSNAIDTIEHIVSSAATGASTLSSGTVEAVDTVGAMSDDSIQRFTAMTVDTKRSAAATAGTYLGTPAPGTPDAGTAAVGATGSGDPTVAGGTPPGGTTGPKVAP